MDRIFGTINGKWCIIFENRELHIKRTKWSDWKAVFIYEGDGIAGEIHRLQGKES